MPLIQNVGTATLPLASADSETSALKTNFGLNPEYLAVLTIADIDNSSATFTTPLSENVSLRIGSDWSDPLSKATENAGEWADKKAASISKKAAVVLQAAKGAATAAGLTAKNKFLSAQVWQSSTPISISIPFLFVANKSAKTDVVDKVRVLMKSAAPSQQGPLIVAPGPSILGNVFGGRHIELRLGNYLLLSNCIIKNVDVQFDTMMGREGLPMKAHVNVEVESFFSCFTKQDIDAMFDKTPFNRTNALWTTS
jgi:hypothetical protein